MQVRFEPGTGLEPTTWPSTRWTMGVYQKKGISPFRTYSWHRTFANVSFCFHRFAFIVSHFYCSLWSWQHNLNIEVWPKACHRHAHNSCTTMPANSLLLTSTSELGVIPHTLYSPICSDQASSFQKRNKIQNYFKAKLLMELSSQNCQTKDKSLFYLRTGYR